MAAAGAFPMRTTDASRHPRCIGRDASLIACATRVRRNAFVKRPPFRERITASTHQPEQTAAMPLQARSRLARRSMRRRHRPPERRNAPGSDRKTGPGPV
ncbi:hypothetical protein DF051_08835 [Burkholderia contaminans]|uniref:Uncharacterized protein n=1 Tax=Burkholderia contaminans TaxID=488447 RepID=A0A3N8Q463_9BURK|nr:hypothetical protein DF051_08835 [Burkholderia contaminans]